MIVFIDTGAWVAIADRNDQYANETSQLYKNLILIHLLQLRTKSAL